VKVAMIYSGIVILKKKPGFLARYLLVYCKVLFYLVFSFIIFPSLYCSKYRSYQTVEYKRARSHFPYHHSVIFQIHIMPVWRVNINKMPKICQTTFYTKEDKNIHTSE